MAPAVPRTVSVSKYLQIEISNMHTVRKAPRCFMSNSSVGKGESGTAGVFSTQKKKHHFLPTNVFHLIVCIMGRNYRAMTGEPHWTCTALCIIYVHFISLTVLVTAESYKYDNLNVLLISRLLLMPFFTFFYLIPYRSRRCLHSTWYG